MKRFSFIIFSVAILLPLLFIACQKEQEGVYNPKKKISRIYTEDYYQSYTTDYQSYTPKHLSEMWEWNGDKLSSIAYYNGNDYFLYKATFAYEENRISQIYMTFGGDEEDVVYLYLFFYQDKMINSIQVSYKEGEEDSYHPGYEYRFTHTGDKITRIEQFFWEDSKMKGRLAPALSPLRFVLPDLEKDYAMLDRMEKRASKGMSYSCMYELEWDKNNIIKATMRDPEYGDEQYEYSYDRKLNPLYGSFLGVCYSGYGGILSEGVMVPWVTSKNNILFERYTNFREWNGTEEYSYTYEGKFPVTCTIQNNRPNESSYRMVTYYEYQ